MGKPSLSIGYIWNMCFGFLGIQIGFALQNANVSRIFQTLGANPDEIAVYWLAAPLTGLLVQPVIGYFSDRTWGRLGRRRPYFFYGAIATTAALLIMPNSPALWVAAGMLWIMDASINVTMEPFRAFVGDMLPERQRAVGYSIQSFFIGLGAVFASFLPWMLTNWAGLPNTAPAGSIPISVKISFYTGAACLFAAVMWTVFRTKEYSPEEMAAFEAAEGQARPSANPGAESATPAPTQFFRNGGFFFILGGIATILIVQMSLEKQLYILSIGGTVFGLMLIIAGLLKQRGQTGNPFSEIIDDLFMMPKTMRQLALVQFFSWFALFCMWINTTSGVAAFHYGSSDPTSQAYNDGADWVSVLFGIYNGIAALAALIIPALAARTSRKIAHMICLACGAAGFFSFILIKDPALLPLAMIGVGIAWAAILSIPYAILSGAVPARKMGIYMGLFNFFIVIPQIVAGTLIGLILRWGFGGEPIYALPVGGASLALAALLVLRVRDNAERADAEPA